EFVYVAAPSAGRLQKLNVRRGMDVKAGEALFSLEAVAEKAVRDEAMHRLEQAKANLEDAQKGRRPSEIAALKAGVMLAEDALALTQMEFARQETLRKTGAVSIDSIDRARSAYAQDQHRLEQLEAELKTAQMGARPDQISALEFEVKARTEALAKSEWDLSQKQQKAPQAGAVYDTLYREGEFVVVGRPVVSLLPPANMKVRAFVSETKLANLHPGDAAKVHVDGLAEAITGKVSFISPHAEYTPPVIYSQENRSKLVFMIELRFEDADAVKLHPGQPVDVEFSHEP
ncbi:MAG: HlyD family efflux transporter periplasmic adaptor subunit, partial [Prosthecobacter sp.]